MSEQLMLVESIVTSKPSIATANALYHYAVRLLDWAYREERLSWTGYILMLIDLDNGYLGDVTNAQAIAACQACIADLERILGKEQSA